jgi:hypothetical protein
MYTYPTIMHMHNWMNMDNQTTFVFTSVGQIKIFSISTSSIIHQFVIQWFWLLFFKIFSTCNIL